MATISVPSLTLREFDRQFCKPTSAQIEYVEAALLRHYLTAKIKVPKGEKPPTTKQIEIRAHQRTAAQIKFLYPGLGSAAKKAA